MRSPALLLPAIVSLGCALLPVALAAQRAEPRAALGVVDESRPPEPPSRVFEAAKGASLSSLAALGEAASEAGDRLRAVAEWNARGAVPRRNGFDRELPAPVAVDLGGDLLARPDGGYRGGILARRAGDLVWGAQVSVAGAFRLRLHLDRVHLPAGARLWVYGADGLSSRPFGAELTGPGGDLWTPSVAGPTVSIEARVPGAALAAGRTSSFRLDRVMEIVRLDPETGEPLTSAADLTVRSTSCLKDATCIAESTFTNVTNVRHAIALIGNVDSSGHFAAECTGELLNDSDDKTTIPYLLTANHCLSTQAEASTLESFFDDETATCNGATPALGTLPRVIGATLMATSKNSDFTLLKLAAFPDNKRYLLGWDARVASLPEGTKLHQISHPFARPQSYSEGTVELHPRFLCPNEDGAPLNDLTKFVYLQPTFGGTFVGSSGSAILLDGGLVVGQLSDGCGPNPPDGCDYRNLCANGAFSATYPMVAQFLNPGPSPCMPDDATLCLNQNRFKVSVQWATPQGTSGNGHAVALSGDTGYFWFFDSGNVEVVTKVLNACGFNDRFWFFAGGLTNVRTTINVTDTVTAASRQYFNHQFTAFQPVQDTAAFETCP
ncbi:MAG TPA: hypothetical protein VOA87_13060 [Thermoanaerobaculia bacterium]|nr:hypothetical protein [Thermoanaerobaculia bacterium]